MAYLTLLPDYYNTSFQIDLIQHDFFLSANNNPLNVLFLPKQIEWRIILDHQFRNYNLETWK